MQEERVPDNGRSASPQVSEGKTGSSSSTGDDYYDYGTDDHDYDYYDHANEVDTAVRRRRPPPPPRTATRAPPPPPPPPPVVALTDPPRTEEEDGDQDEEQELAELTADRVAAEEALSAFVETPPGRLNRTLLDLSCLKLFGQGDLPRIVPPAVPNGGVVSYNRSVYVGGFPTTGVRDGLLYRTTSYSPGQCRTA